MSVWFTRFAVRMWGKTEQHRIDTFERFSEDLALVLHKAKGVRIAIETVETQFVANSDKEKQEE